MDSAELDQVLRRPARYWNSDGLPLLGMGALWLLWGAALFAMEAFKGRWKLLAFPITLIVVVVAFSLNGALKRMKQRITEPRAGVMRVRAEKERTVAVGAFAAAFALAAAVVVAKYGVSGELLRALPGALGLVVAAAFFFAAYRCGIPSYSVAGFCALISGLILSVLRVGFPGAMGWILIMVGVSSIACGATDLHRFLREHPLKSSEEMAR